MKLPFALRLARRQMRSGLSGFRIFFASLVLGVLALASVGSMSESLLSGLAQHGQVFLGGDVSVRLVHRQTTTEESNFLALNGAVSEIASMRAMAYATENDAEGERQLAELKAVDGRYPLYGRVETLPNVILSKALDCAQTLCGAIVEQALLDRLHVKRGAIIRIGKQDFRIAAVLLSEPDRISGGFSLGPHILISSNGLRRTGIVVYGSLVEYCYRIKAPPSFSPTTFRTTANEKFPAASWEIRTRDNPTPGTRSFIVQVTMFLTLTALTILAIGGVGAGQSISAYLDRKRDEVAILKSLGADGALVFTTFLAQIMAIASLAVVVGDVAGVVIPYLIQLLCGASLPVTPSLAIFPEPLLLAAAFGLLAAATSAIPALARAVDIAPGSLIRDAVDRSPVHARAPYYIASSTTALATVLLAIAIAPSKLFALEVLAGAACGLVILRLVAGWLVFVFGMLPRPHNAYMRLAVANLVRPGAPTVGVITALGLGLTLLVTVTLLSSTVSGQVTNALPESAPSFFFLDIQLNQTAQFNRLVAHARSATDYRLSPMIRGRIISLKGVAARDATVSAGSRWALAGDRGITYAAKPPEDAQVVAGKWWPPHYAGPTLISFDADLARGMNLRVGDVMGLNVLGREIDGHIANLREVNFRSGRQNFAIILSPGIIDKAPHSFLASVRVAPRDEEPLYRAVTSTFPNVSAVRVKDAIAQVSALLQQLNVGVRLASIVTVVAGLFVLSGAIAASQRARAYDATILKVLGATRFRIAGIYALEYGILGFVCALVSLALGTAAAWAISSAIFNFPLDFDASAIAVTAGGGIVVTLVLGLAGSWATLAARPGRQLREN